MRNKVIQDAQILSLIDFGSFKVFSSGIQTMIMTFKKTLTLTITRLIVEDFLVRI